MWSRLLFARSLSWGGEAASSLSIAAALGPSPIATLCVRLLLAALPRVLGEQCPEGHAAFVTCERPLPPIVAFVFRPSGQASGHRAAFEARIFAF